MEFYDDYYQKPTWWFHFRYDTQIKRKTCLELLKKVNNEWDGKRIFELGFGPGDLLFSFPYDCKIYGAELSSSAVSRALAHRVRNKYKKYNFFEVHGNEHLPLPDEFVDLAIVSHVLEHVENDIMCVQELHRILKPGRFLAVLVPINERYKDPNHLRQFTFDSCKGLCERNGFKLLHGFENEFFFYIVEKLYWNHQNKEWDWIVNMYRIMFNLITAPLPFYFYKMADSIIKGITKLKPRQAALLFKKA